MGYTRQNFKKGQTLTAGAMNSIDVWLEYICGKELTAAALINGELVFTFQNGDTLNVGEIMNTEGAAGNGISDVVMNDDHTLTFEFTDGTSYTTPSLRGAAGKDGKDYVLTDADKTEIAQMAADTVEIPTKLPNPNRLTINGTSYDGSKAVTVNIEGGSGGGDTIYSKITYNAETGENTSTMTAAEIKAAYESGSTVVVVIETSGDVIDVREGSSVLAPAGNSTLLADILTETDKYHVVIECTDSSNPENGRIKVQHSSMAAQPLIGTNEDITPEQVVEALADGRPIAITLTGTESGLDITFNSFVNMADSVVIGSTVAVLDGFPQIVQLMGYVGEGWLPIEDCNLARYEDVVTPNFAANEDEVGFINNRTHYVDKNGVVHKLDNKFIDADWMATSEQVGGAPVFNASVKFENKMYLLGINNQSIHVNAGVEYDVYWGMGKYVCTPFEASGELFMGNADLQSFESVKENPLSNKNAPFLFTGMNDTLTMIMAKSLVSGTQDIRIETHAVSFYNKLPKEYLPDDISVAKICSKAEIELMTLKEFTEEYNNHPIILRVEGVGATDDHADILLSMRGSSIGGCGFSRRPGEIIWANVSEHYNNGKLQCTTYGLRIPNFGSYDNSEGFLYKFSSNTWGVKQLNYEPTTVQLPAEYLVDGASMPIDNSELTSYIEKYMQGSQLLILTMSGTNYILLPVLYVSISTETVATSIKCLSPTDGSIITITLIPSSTA